MSPLQEEVLILLSGIWDRQNGSEFDLKHIAHRIYETFGIYGEKLTSIDVERALKNDSRTDWQRISNAAYETICGYVDGPIVGEESVLAVGTLLLYLLAIDQGYGEVGCCIDAAVAIMFHLRGALDVEQKHLLIGYLASRD